MDWKRILAGVLTLGGSEAAKGAYDWYKDSKQNGGTFSSIVDAITGRSNTEATNSATAALQEDAQAHQSELAAVDRAWKEEQMNIERERADTAIQRQTADLQAAGLNPWLAAGTQGAGSPGVANTTMSSSSANSAMNATMSGAQIAIGLMDSAARIIKAANS